MYTVGHGICQENWKPWKMRNIHLTTWKMTKSLQKVKNEKCKLSNLEYGEKTENHRKWEKYTLGREIRQGKLKNLDNLEMSTVAHGICKEHWKSWKMRNIHLTTWKMTKSLQKVKNEKCTLSNLEYGEKTENHRKWEIHTLGREIWRGKVKKVENLGMSTVGHVIWQENWKSWKMRNIHLKNDEIKEKREK